jgi:geranylgeranyl transferase type-1 subunit beta
MAGIVILYSFAPTVFSAEHDMRFVFCACAISFILNDWSGFDVQRTIDYIVSSQNYDGGFGFAPHVESYGILS